MKRVTSDHNYQVWPFRFEALSQNGDRNNGGIDLVAQPELIDQIHEASDENGLRSLFISLNKPAEPFMTLGCLADYDGNDYYSYIEFTLRDQLVARNEDAITDIHHQWLDWLNNCLDDQPQLAVALRQNVVWEYREFSLRGSAPQYLITLWCRAQSTKDHSNLISWVQLFFKSGLESVQN